MNQMKSCKYDTFSYRFMHEKGVKSEIIIKYGISMEYRAAHDYYWANEKLLMIDIFIIYDLLNQKSIVGG